MPRKPDDCEKNEKKQNKKPRKKAMKARSGTTDQIQISKQLLAKKISAPKAHRKNNTSKTLENGKPMPSLAELERMYEDSDNENTEGTENESKTLAEASNVNTTPKLLSSSILQEISLRLMDKISKMLNPTKVLDELPPPPVMKPKKRKKPEEHYIVGCKDRPQVIKKPTTMFCKGSGDYGVDRSAHIEDDEIPKKRAKKSKTANVCKSLFNAKNDEIAEMLKDSAGNISDSSVSSAETVSYDCSNCSPQSIRPPSFSPLPSTSRDDNIINQNEKMFNESFTINKTCNTNNSIDLQNGDNTELVTEDIEIIEVPIETIVLDDELPKKFVQQYSENDSSNHVKIVEPINKINTENESPIVIDDYSNLRIDITCDDDIIEIIDVDDIITANKSIIQKYEKKKLIGTVKTADKILNVNEMQENKKDRNPQIVPNNISTPSNATKVNVNVAETVDLTTPQNKQLAVNTNHCNQNQNISLTSSSNISEIDRVSIEFPLGYNATSTPCNMRNINKQPQQSNRMTPSSNEGLVNKHIDSPQGHNTLRCCPICMESIKGKNIASTLCGHVFCMECIKRSIKYMGKRCPTCRKAFRGIGYHQIFL
ncbi:hypothetical protein K1T71_003085 [Dendrolimus kikuchii]|uniref:Uncharacterized protein n=1 Tax=Dendrolimus kikuchii TaxID=765133 RepID=A0ACC1DAZ0_9NEOP|nr:hypothetical protein K1T71_003085 [Dendrolimus kikuchii]